MSLYQYVAGNPLLLTDPLGLFWGGVGRFFQGLGQVVADHAAANWEAMKTIADDPCAVGQGLVDVHDQITTQMAQEAVATSLNTGGDLSTGELLVDIGGQMTGMKAAAEAMTGVDLAENRLLTTEERIFDKTAEAAGGVALVTGTAAAVAAPLAGAARASAATAEAAAASPADDLARIAGQAAKTETTLPEGSFSIVDWSGYPSGVPKPSGPFRLLKGSEYDGARVAANQANRALRQADHSLHGKQIHEIHPVKFGGNPTAASNKMPLTPQQHARVTTWWNRAMHQIQSGAP